MEKIKALLYVKKDSRFSYLQSWMSRTIEEYNAIETDDGETFITMIANGYPDVILIEQDLCGPDGLEMIRTMRQDNINVPFVLLMDDFVDSIVRESIELGGLNIILATDDPVAVRQKLVLCRHVAVNMKKTEAKMAASSLVESIDQLTGSLNRREFMRKIGDGEMKTVIILNIDDFGLINNTYGIPVGDELLTKTALLLRTLLRENSSLYRISGDEFAVIIKGTDASKGSQTVRKIQRLFARERIPVENLELVISFTIGFAYGNGRDLLQKADIALRRAREIGRNRFEEYSHNPELEKQQKENLMWARKIADAIESDRFFPMFQPIVDNASRKVQMYESLARMLDSDTVIGPNQFIQPAEHAGLLHHITRAIIEKSFAAFSANEFDFSINVSKTDLNDNFLVPFIAGMLERYPVRPERFIIEISEGVQSAQHQTDIDQIKALKALGVKIAFDDFGKGYSNFCRILDLMPDYIKIDGSFIQNLDHNGRGYKISHTITQFGKSIDTKVIAEYVHSKDILDRVLKLEVQYSQGYYFGKPQRTITGRIATDEAIGR